MAAFAYSLFTVFGVLLIGTGLALQILYIKNDQNFDTYLPHQIASLAINIVVVCYLMFVLIVYRPYSSQASILLTVFGLMVGLGLEIWANQFSTSEATNVLEYVLAGFNAMLRLYVLIQTRCDASLTTIPEIVNKVVQVAKTTGQPVIDVAKQVGRDLGTIDPTAAFGNISGQLGTLDLGDKKNAIKDAIRKGLGLEPKNKPVGGRRR